MASAREASKQQDGWLPSSPLSLNAGTGWGASAPSAETKEANAGTEAAPAQEPEPHYLTTSGLFERPPRPSAWKEDVRESTPAPASAPAPSELVNGFRSALIQAEGNEREQPRKIGKATVALAVVGILLAATAAAIYLYHPKTSVAEFHTAKTWVAKKWTSDLQKISNVFHPQAAGLKNSELNQRHALSALLRVRRPAKLGIPAARTAVWETQPKKKVTPFYLYVADSYANCWVLTPAGQELGPMKINSPTCPPRNLKPGPSVTAPKH